VIDAVTIGETLATFRSDTVEPLAIGSPLRLSIAGAESNVAIGLARLGHAVRWAGCVGDDDFGRLVLRTLRAEGVDTSCIRCVDDAATALLVKHQRLARISRVSYYRTGSAGTRLAPGLTLAALADRPQLLHVTGITPALGASASGAVTTAIDAAQECGAHVSFDVNYRSALWSREDATATLRPLAARADTVFASEDELELLDEDHLEGTVVVKRGADGAALDGPEGAWEERAVSVDAVDTVGAGDAFVAGYLSALLDGLDPPSRLRRACATAAFAISTHGDWEGLPSRRELRLLELDTNTTLR
jgi:2-dehydro-3-deoxygluconokinase